MQKYDVPRPTYDRWCSLGVRGLLPRHGISFILAKRCAALICVRVFSNVCISGADVRPCGLHVGTQAFCAQTQPARTLRGTGLRALHCAGPRSARRARGGRAGSSPEDNARRACRTFLTLYMTLVQEVLQSVEEQEEALQQGHEPADIDWGEIWHKLKSTLPDIGWGALREWLTEGIRIFYARRVYRNCNRRLTWKLLKGARPHAP